MFSILMLLMEVLSGDLKLQVTNKGVNVVFHYAANPKVRVSTTNPEIHFNDNVMATFNLLEAMRRSDVKEPVFASSSSVYGEPEDIPVSEDVHLRPYLLMHLYGTSRVACEALIHAYSRLYGIRAAVLRYTNVVRPRLRHGVIYGPLMKLR
ncbi:MAG: NAD-dependent epimerase/dehydratase family protein [Desulfurococcaceae archaeon]